MAWGTDRFCLFPALLPLLLLLCLETAPGGAHSLSYDFSVTSKPRPGQPWCEVQGQVDGKSFLSYDCGSDEVRSSSFLGTLVNATKIWKEQTETLSYVGDLLKEQLPELKPGTYRTEGRMTCQREASGVIHGSWQFGCDGQMSLLFDSEKGHWTVVHPGGILIKNKWESDRDVMKSFKKISVGDCKRWLENFLASWEDEMNTTAIPSTAPFKVITPTSWVLFLILACAIILCIQQ